MAGVMPFLLDWVKVGQRGSYLPDELVILVSVKEGKFIPVQKMRVCAGNRKNLLDETLSLFLPWRYLKI